MLLWHPASLLREREDVTESTERMRERRYKGMEEELKKRKSPTAGGYDGRER